jgi:rubredoxin
MLQVVKTIGGNNGAPEKCGGCGNMHFAKSGIAWHCTSCGVYHPTKLGFESIKENLKQLERLKNQITFQRQKLEDLVGE